MTGNDRHLPQFQLAIRNARAKLGRLVEMADIGNTDIGITKNVPADDVATAEPRAVLISYAKYCQLLDAAGLPNLKQTTEEQS